MSRVDQVVLSTKAKAAGWSTGIGQGMGMGQYLDGELGAVGTLGHSTIYTHIYMYIYICTILAPMRMYVYAYIWVVQPHAIINHQPTGGFEHCSILKIDEIGHPLVLGKNPGW